jgi:hypothetical protein
MFQAFGRAIVDSLKNCHGIDKVALNAVFYNLLIVNSALSPLVYFIFLKNFREAFKRRLPCNIGLGWCVEKATQQD